MNKPKATLEFNPISGEYEIDHWVAMCILGSKALVQIRRGKAVVCGVFANGVIREVVTGSKEKLSGPWVASSKGWVLLDQ